MSKRKNKRVVCPEPSKADINRAMEAAGLLRDSLIDEQAAEIERLKTALAGVTKERDWFEQCLKSAESALIYKDKVIDKIKKNNAKKLADKQDIIDMLDDEVAFQYKRANKAVEYIKAIGGALGVIKEKVDGYGERKGKSEE